jgi:hypothetical protein
MSAFNGFLNGVMAGQKRSEERSLFNEAMATSKVDAELARRKGMMVSDAGAMAGEGNYTGAANLAATAGDADLAKHFATMDEASRRAAADKITEVGKVAAAISSLDPSLQAEAIRYHGQRLGFSPEQVEQAAMNPQVALAGLSASARDIEKMMAQSIPEVRTEGDQMFAIRTGPGGQAAVSEVGRRDQTFEETETARANRADEAIARQNAATAAANAAKPSADAVPKLSDVKGIRETNEKRFQGFEEAQRQFQTMGKLAQDATGASDVALGFAFFKTIDPSSTVREGEFAAAASSMGLGAQAVATFERLDSGQKFSPQLRKDLLTAAGHAFELQKRDIAALVERERAFAQRYGLNPDDIARDPVVAGDPFDDLPPGATPVPF